MVVINIDIIFDVTCVWCFIGERVLEKAIALYQKTYPDGKHDTFHVTWRPYYLCQNPHAASVEKRQLTTEKKVQVDGWTAERIERTRRRIDQIGQGLGITWAWGGKVGHTREAHRLVHLCQVNPRYAAEVRDRVVEGLFQAYHERELDITEHEVLRQIMVRAGVDTADVDYWLDSGIDRELVDAEATANRSVTNAGVPLFIVQDHYHVDGAQDLEAFMDVFVKLKEKEQKSKQGISNCVAQVLPDFSCHAHQ